MEHLTKLLETVNSLKEGKAKQDAVIAFSQALGFHIDSKIREDDKVAVGKLIHEATTWELTVLVGTQLNHIIESEPKFCKDLPKDLKFYKDHFKVYQVKHVSNYRAGIRIPVGDDLFL